MGLLHFDSDPDRVDGDRKTMRHRNVFVCAAGTRMRGETTSRVLSIGLRDTIFRGTMAGL